MTRRIRHEIGHSASPDPRRSVFINCPFDAKYLPLFDAIVLTTMYCGYVPRCALETGSVSDPRLDRIYEALNSSRYSIHDFSRCKGEADANFARFNMPLEFGIAFGKGYLSSRDHDWLVLLPTGHFYKQCISDLGGYDPSTYKNTIESLVQPVMSWLLTRPNAWWLRTRPDATIAQSPDRVMAKMKDFEKELEKQRKKLGESFPWKNLLQTARDFVPPGGDLRRQKEGEPGGGERRRAQHRHLHLLLPEVSTSAKAKGTDRS